LLARNQWSKKNVILALRRECNFNPHSVIAVFFVIIARRLLLSSHIRHRIEIPEVVLSSTPGMGVLTVYCTNLQVDMINGVRKESRINMT
jgi:hypothetical protein